MDFWFFFEGLFNGGNFKIGLALKTSFFLTRGWALRFLLGPRNFSVFFRRGGSRVFFS